MKLALPKNNFAAKRKNFLPLTGAAKQHTKNNSCTFELLSDPRDATSQKYKLTILRLSGGEDVRTILEWRLDLIKVLSGLGCGPSASAKIICTILNGTPQTTFETMASQLAQQALEAAIAAVPDDPTDPTAKPTAQQALRDAGRDPHLTDLMVTHSVGHMVKEMMPKKILARVKRDMRRDTRKPSDMTIRDYYNHLMRMNILEIHNLPPFAPGQVFSNDEIIDIMTYGIPKSWQREMDRQGFDPYDTGNPIDLVNFLEQIEAAEEHDAPTKSTDNGNSKKKNSSSKNSSKKKSNDASGEKVFCKEHGWNFSHTTEECKVINGGGKKFKSNNGKKKSYGNKTWNRKSDDTTDTSKKELAALIQQSVRAELNKLEKKRKSDSDDEEFDMAAIEAELEGFNYKDDGSVEASTNKDDEVTV